MCLPKSAGGYNLLNIRVWNRVTITNADWDLAQKKDKMWIKWIHTYYIKGQSILEMNLPQQASWMVRKIIEAKEMIQQKPTVQYRHSSTKQIYLGILGSYSKVAWRNLMFRNEARPKAISTMWMQCHGRLLTTDSFTKTVWERLMQWIRIHVTPMKSYEQMMAWVITQAKGKSCKAKIMKMVYGEHIYGIWRERNSRIFEEATRTADQIAREVACVCNIRAQGGMRAQMQQLIF
ncbi:uncharacterized protein [Nicotiana sylvestris]|uniref:Uncharacterized protein n=2 Tax=Nicotiana TaxID=4085 RepID=A0A1S3YCX8_TOBAC|nr:PREDICTED: uncharacterized protein LOC104237964 [Nicotiana sylvestris]XP_016449984.1 PREDICTED: uncharacterized protein LOC107774845 [Nicotiana tabacum]